MEKSEQVVFVYTTFGSLEEAQRVAGSLIESGLVACANMLPGMQAMYMWDGELQHETEIAVLLKTRKERCEEAMTLLGRLHPYDTPAITAFAAMDAAPSFVSWVVEQTTPTAPG